MTIPDPRDALFNAIDIKKIRIDKFKGFVFLCGGPRARPPQVSPASAREHIYNYLLANHTNLFSRVRWAEDIKDWFDPESLYGNLIDFENDVAELADAVVIFIESHGAIAELGSFCQIDTIASKLLVFVQETYHRDGSFIDLGPVSFLESKNNHSVLVYPWAFNRNNEYLKESLDGSEEEIVEDISEHLAAVGGTVKFDPESVRHKILLICDILDQCSALTLTELRKYLTKLGLIIKRKPLKRLLFILEKFEYLTIIPRGHNTYYVTKENPSTISYSISSKVGVSTDTMRRKSEILEYYENSPAEVRRFNAILQERRKGVPA